MNVVRNINATIRDVYADTFVLRLFIFISVGSRPLPDAKVCYVKNY
jgi:hypothetical protein